MIFSVCRWIYTGRISRLRPPRVKTLSSGFSRRFSTVGTAAAIQHCAVFFLAAVFPLFVGLGMESGEQVVSTRPLRDRGRCSGPRQHRRRERVGQRSENPVEFKERSRPAVSHDQGQRCGRSLSDRRAQMDEMDPPSGDEGRGSRRSTARCSNASTAAPRAVWPTISLATWVRSVAHRSLPAATKHHRYSLVLAQPQRGVQRCLLAGGRAASSYVREVWQPHA